MRDPKIDEATQDDILAMWRQGKGVHAIAVEVELELFEVESVIAHHEGYSIAEEVREPGERVLGIDPGNLQSAYAVLEDGVPVLEHCAKVRNGDLRDMLLDRAFGPIRHTCEWIESYGMPVGETVFNTVRWIGRFQEVGAACAVPFELIPRRVVKLYMCHTMRANDSNVRSALINWYGGDRKSAVGTKADPGPLHGVKADVWQAIALAFTVQRVRERFPSTRATQ